MVIFFFFLFRLPQETAPTWQAQVSTVESDAAPDVGNQWRNWQEEEPALVQLKGWVREGHIPRPKEREASLPVVRRLLREWSRLHIQEGVLKCRVLERHTGLSHSQIVVPTSKTHELWKKYHTLGHMGVAKMEALLRKAFYWPGMTTDLQEWASKCASCVQQKRGPEERAPLVPILTSYPLETVSIDYLSLGRHDDTYPYLLVMNDLITKYGWAVPTKD